MLKNSILSSISGQDSKLYVDDVFSTWLRTGTGADATVTTGIDMTKGYCLWSKGRSGATDHAIYHSARGLTLDLATNTTAGQTTQATGLKAVSATGHTVGSLAKMNTSGATYADWVFRNADKFYGHQFVTKTAGSNAVINFANLGTLGTVRVKRTDSTGSWYIWHRSLSAGQLLIGETTAAAATLGHVTVSGTTVTLVNGVIADGTYLVEAFAHDSSADGIVQCGSFTTDGSGRASVDLGWESQFILVKRMNSTEDWQMYDSMRGLTYADRSKKLLPNLSSMEADGANINLISTGFVVTGLLGGIVAPYIYLAIRRPNKPPTTGTQVYSAVSFATASDSFADVQVGFPVDLIYSGIRTTSSSKWDVLSRMTGARALQNFASTGAESTLGSNRCDFDRQSGIIWRGWSAGFSALWHAFRRAPGFMETFAYTGNGVNSTVAHGLAVIPDLLIVKSRSNATDWQVWYNGLTASEKLVLNSNTAKATDATAWNSTLPTSTNISVGTSANTNTNNATYIAYSFSNLQGIQKIGTYTGDGTSGRVIDCGFTTGARFICIKAVSTTGSWLVSDSTRGITSSSDPYLQLNSTAAEVTTEDWLDPSSSGFVVNNVSSSNANTIGVTYFYWAIS